MVDVFVSYKQEEREAVQIIASTLADLKLVIWFDTKLRAGGSFDEEIAAALRAANAVLVCWTPAAIQSEWVRAEATDGLNKNRLAACFLHPTELIPPFTLTHAENLSAWAGQTDDPAWIKLVERQARAFLAENTWHHWHPITAAAREKFERLDAEAWLSARADGSEGEGAEGRLAREKAEARAAAEKRKAQAEKSRRLLQRGHEPVCAVPLRAYEVAFARGR